MAKAHSKKGSPNGKKQTQVNAASPVETSLKADRKTEALASAAPAKMSPGLRKQVRRLERQLAEAAREELKRVRKLEKAHHRLQRAEVALDELRAAGAMPVPATTKADAPATTTAAASTAAAKTPARTGAVRSKPAARKPAASKAASKAAAPVSKPEPAAAEPAQDLAPES